MPFSESYRRQVATLVRLLPSIAAEDCFALKGGTAINLFIRDMPRLSVDIDLTYMPIAPRAQSLEQIHGALGRIAERLEAGPVGATVTRHDPAKAETTITRLTARSNSAQVKIEVTPVLRGCVHEPQLMAVAPSVEDEFGFAEAPVVSFPDLYAGKIVAALDRQHPRDLFDVRELLEREGMTDELRRAFVVYLISHNRPAHEIIDPTRKDLGHEYHRGFLGMTNTPVAIDHLIDTREELITQVVSRMSDVHRRFLVSFERGEPDWSLLGIDHVERLPAVRWKQQNLDKLDRATRSQLVARLEAVLE
jgi:predicted nucleotidyltransferase component of viral defense system